MCLFFIYSLKHPLYNIQASKNKGSKINVTMCKFISKENNCMW